MAAHALTPAENQLLGALPPSEYKRLLPRFEVMTMKIRDALYEPRQPMEHVYFPLRGVASMVAVMDDGTMDEVGTVGHEGMLGIQVFLGTEKTSTKAFGQVPGAAARMTSADLRAEVKRGGPLVSLLQRYTQALFVMLAQHTACNRLHPVQQRAARWVLTTHDRVHDDDFSLTQE